MSETSQGPGWWLAADGRWYPPTTGATEGAHDGPVRPRVPGSFSPDPAAVAGSVIEDPAAGPLGPTAGVTDTGTPVTDTGTSGTDPEGSQADDETHRRSRLPAVLGAVAVVAIVAIIIVFIIRTHDRSNPTDASPVAVASAPAPRVLTADRASQNELIHAITLLKSQYSFLNTYGLVTITWLAQRAPKISWVGGVTPVHQATQVSLAITPQSALVATQSKDGACWYVLDAEPGASALLAYQLPGPAMYFNMRTGAACEGSDPPMNGWGQTFPQP